jgi:hypothetical protein
VGLCHAAYAITGLCKGLSTGCNGSEVWRLSGLAARIVAGVYHHWGRVDWCLAAAVLARKWAWSCGQGAMKVLQCRAAVGCSSVHAHDPVLILRVLPVGTQKLFCIFMLHTCNVAVTTALDTILVLPWCQMEHAIVTIVHSLDTLSIVYSSTCCKLTL